jgi:hypothetical protein
MMKKGLRRDSRPREPALSEAEGSKPSAARLQGRRTQEFEKIHRRGIGFP